VSWLSKEERAFIKARLRADSDNTNDEKFRWADVLFACKDVKVWLYGLAFHTMSLPLYTLSLFLVSSYPPRPSWLYLLVTAHNYSRHGLHLGAVSAADHSSVCCSHHLHHLLGDSLGTLRTPCVVHSRHYDSGHYRIYHSPRQYEPQSATWSIVLGHILRSDWHLSICCPCAMLACNQRVGPNEARYCKCDANIDWQSGRCDWYAVVSTENRTEICLGSFIRTGLSVHEPRGG
jgi:hypothetical protein